EPAHGHPALPRGGVELRGNRRRARLLAVGDEIVDPPRAGDVEGEAEAVFKKRALGITYAPVFNAEGAEKAQRFAEGILSQRSSANLRVLCVKESRNFLPATV